MPMGIYPRKSIEERLWSKIQKTDGCWLWTAATTGNGYGKIMYAGRLTPAHRVVWILTNGPIPPETPHVLHRCDSPPCCNPTHLFLGTPSDNSKDMYAKGRWKAKSRAGENNNKAKLTVLDVLTIRRMCPPDRRIRYGLISKVANKYAVTAGTITSIVNGKTWTHVQQEAM